MVKIKTRDLKGAALDWAVASIKDVPIIRDLFHDRPILVDPQTKAVRPYAPSHDLAQGYALVHEHGISVCRYDDDCVDAGDDNRWFAMPPNWGKPESPTYDGPEPLVAAMRCLVATELGDEVCVPEEYAS